MQLWTQKNLPLFNNIHLELQSDCNRECFFCPRQGDKSGKRINPDGSHVKESMPTELVLSIMDELYALGFQGTICLRHLSEAFLDPRIIDMAKAAKERGFRVIEATNGDALKKDKRLCQEVVKIYEGICIGLYDVKNEKEAEKEKEFWKQRLAGIEVSFSEVKDVFWRSHTKWDPRMVDKPRSYPHGPCNWPSQMLIIHYNAEMALCCEDMLEEFSLGNARKSSIRDLWYSQRHLQIINDLEMGNRFKYPLCSQCPAKPTSSAHNLEFQEAVS